MELEASHKVPEGKMVKVKIKYDEEVEDADIRGDFFIQPATAINELEDRLGQISLDTSKDEVVEKLEGVEADLIGFSRESIAEAFRKAADEVEK